MPLEWPGRMSNQDPRAVYSRGPQQRQSPYSFYESMKKRKPRRTASRKVVEYNIYWIHSIIRTGHSYTPSHLTAPAKRWPLGPSTCCKAATLGARRGRNPRAFTCGMLPDFIIRTIITSAGSYQPCSLREFLPASLYILPTIHPANGHLRIRPKVNSNKYIIETLGPFRWSAQANMDAVVQHATGGDPINSREDPHCQIEFCGYCPNVWLRLPAMMMRDHFPIAFGRAIGPL
jgi:hypothetical protein